MAKATVLTHTNDMLDSIARQARKEERIALVALCHSLKSEHWTPAKHDRLDGLDRTEYYDAACEDIATAILARKA